jgi:hypothetical protein
VRKLRAWLDEATLPISRGQQIYAALCIFVANFFVVWWLLGWLLP